MHAASADSTATGGEIVFLSALTPAEDSALRAEGVNRVFERGTAIFHEQGVADRVVVVLSGCVKLSCLSAEGKEVILAIRGPGDLLGELSAVDGRPRSATATALDRVEAMGVSAAQFVRYLEQHPRVALVVLRMLGARLREADLMRIELSAHDSMSRVAARIVELCERFGDEVEAGVQIDLPISQEELAGWTGCSRDSVVKALQSMRGLGWLQTGRRSITVLALEDLRRRAA
jgi:CRP/FNR family transcriptional regulator, cyclic AMP receptor protein